MTYYKYQYVFNWYWRCRHLYHIFHYRYHFVYYCHHHRRRHRYNNQKVLKYYVIIMLKYRNFCKTESKQEKRSLYVRDEEAGRSSEVLDLGGFVMYHLTRITGLILRRTSLLEREIYTSLRNALPISRGFRISRDNLASLVSASDSRCLRIFGLSSIPLSYMQIPSHTYIILFHESRIGHWAFLHFLPWFNCLKSQWIIYRH